VAGPDFNLDKDGLLFDECLNGVAAWALDRDIAEVRVGSDDHV
jgi:hypothetical protein